MEVNTEQPLKNLKAQVLEYIELKIELIKVSALEHAVKIASSLAIIIIGIILGSFFFMFLLLALSFFIGQWLHSYGFGFLISSSVYLLIIWYFATIGKKQIQNYMIKKILKQIEYSSKNK